MSGTEDTIPPAKRMDKEDRDISEWLYDENTTSVLIIDPDEPKIHISDAKSPEELDEEVEADTEMLLRYNGSEGLAALRDLCLHNTGGPNSLGASLERLLEYMFKMGRTYERYLQEAED